MSSGAAVGWKNVVSVDTNETCFSAVGWKNVVSVDTNETCFLALSGVLGRPEGSTLGG